MIASFICESIVTVLDTHGGFLARVNCLTRGWVNYVAFLALMRVN